MNQRIKQESPNDNLTTEIPPSQRVYLFRDLPSDVQQNLLRLQNSDGDFLRYGSDLTYARGGLLFLLSVGCVLFLADFLSFLDAFENAVFAWKWVIVFSGGALIFALCFLYLCLGFFRTRRSPIKNGIYLTPTQVIETADGLVRYRELKDAGEISVNRWEGGWRNALDIKFADGDLYQYILNVPGGYRGAAQFAETKRWQEKAGSWRNEAINAAQRGDRAYFDSLDVIQKSAMANSSALKKNFPSRLPMRLMFIITMAMILITFIIYWIIKLSG
jgi:hypothetical protein